MRTRPRITTVPGPLIQAVLAPPDGLSQGLRVLGPEWWATRDYEAPQEFSTVSLGRGTCLPPGVPLLVLPLRCVSESRQRQATPAPLIQVGSPRPENLHSGHVPGGGWRGSLIQEGSPRPENLHSYLIPGGGWRRTTLAMMLRLRCARKEAGCSPRMSACPQTLRLSVPRAGPWLSF